MWFRNAFLFFILLLGFVAGDSGDAIDVVTFKPKALLLKEYQTWHRLSSGNVKPLDEDEHLIDVDKNVKNLESKNLKKVVPKYESFEKKYESTRRDLASNDDAEGRLQSESTDSKQQARVQLETFGDSGVLQEDGVKRTDGQQKRYNIQRDSIIPGVYISDEYPTTMLPILTTPREARSFDFVPVNIIRENAKDAYNSFPERHFGDIGDVSLVPAGTNSRIQVKKGPNGKDYEYETTVSPPRRSSSSTGNSNRSKYTSVERSSTVEPVSNEVIPNRNRGRQLAEPETETIPEERLPTNTRFPPRSRSNHNSGTTEATRGRGNRPRLNFDLIDSSSFRTHQEGPEFPQSLPKGPVRFLGVTPNEDSGERPSRTRSRPQRVQEPAPVQESNDDVPPLSVNSRRRPVQAELEITNGQSKQVLQEQEEEQEDNNSRTVRPQIDDATTEYPSAMDKVALDLYAFLQQGQSNLVDSTSEPGESSDGDSTTPLATDETTAYFETTTEELSGTTTDSSSITSTVKSTTTTTTTTTTTEPTTTSTTTLQTPAGRGKFRRPGIPSGIGTRNRFKTNGSSATTEASTTESNNQQRTRGRFGSNGSNGSLGFKRPRPGQKQPVDEDTAQKESVPSRNRFRSSGAPRLPSTTTTSAPSANNAVNSNSAIARPTFNKLNINRRRGRPTTPAPVTSEDGQEPNPESSLSTSQETSNPTTPKSSLRSRLPGPAVRPIVRPGSRIGARKPGQVATTASSSSTLPPEAAAEVAAEATPEEPTGEGTEEETREAPAETSPSGHFTTANPLNKLRNRNRLQVQPKSTSTRSPLSLTPKRSPLLPRRKVTEPVLPTVSPTVSSSSSLEESAAAAAAAAEKVAVVELTDEPSAETSTAASTKHEETRGLSSLLAPRRRIAPRRPGQIVARE
ncbi:mucin-2-like isoform X2 [Prorops nasuta]|uniref:mucin-2-like isoform X2 n=1 Tax=Prorops nasuta TaxID=863751 RepID=UPI0034CF2FB2